jgi:hypothetical protein
VPQVDPPPEVDAAPLLPPPPSRRRTPADPPGTVWVDAGAWLAAYSHAREAGTSLEVERLMRQVAT